MMTRRVREWFWLHVLDVLNWWPLPVRHKLYLWVVGKASDCTDWGPEARG